MEERLDSTPAEEVERLKAAELAAEQPYNEAMKRSDMSAARIAADDWLKLRTIYPQPHDIPMDVHDIPMDVIVTERGAMSPQGCGSRTSIA
jgi:hypothetical protein